MSGSVDDHGLLVAPPGAVASPSGRELVVRAFDRDRTPGKFIRDELGGIAKIPLDLKENVTQSFEFCVILENPSVVTTQTFSSRSSLERSYTLFLHFSGSAGTTVVDLASRIGPEPPFAFRVLRNRFNSNMGCGSFAEESWRLADFRAFWGNASQFRDPFIESLQLPEDPVCYSSTINRADNRGSLANNVTKCRCPCQETALIAERYNVTWWAHENPVVAPLQCRGVRYWVVLRHPIERILARLFSSWYMQQQHTVTLELAKAALINNTNFMFGPQTKEFSGSAALNNYYVRSLVGPSVYALPLGAVSRFHLKAALTVLSTFDVVLPFPYISSLPSVAGRLYGHCIKAEVVHAHDNSHPPDFVAEMQRRALADKLFMNLLHTHNMLDAEL
mmetsp:Transcript_3394/g.7186  ORF Transcript_3394/g.7186 Transcript_3394/m.7186 type:complete len:390 (+) Transcript_3394:431-1600(+)